MPRPPGPRGPGAPWESRLALSVGTARSKLMQCAFFLQVAKILEGILGRLTSHKTALLREAAGRGQVTAEAKAELRGLLRRLRAGRGGRAAAVAALAAEVARESPDAGCRYFGACGGSDGPMDEATKAQVAALLNGILGRLQR
ncbi:unnamed protein product [Prorocentrum cordatum]|nr:unnamed protein product [Polarella glacialis]